VICPVIQSLGVYDVCPLPNKVTSRNLSLSPAGCNLLYSLLHTEVINKLNIDTVKPEITHTFGGHKFYGLSQVMAFLRFSLDLYYFWGQRE
jgi:hypothetical protein